MDETSDRHLVASVLDGSEDAGRRLFDRHWPTAWRVAYGILGRHASADEVAQDAIAKAFVNLEVFDQDRPFAPWLRRIVVNEALNALRRQGRYAELVAETPDHTDWVGDTLLHAELIDVVSRLPIERRVAIVLRYWLDLTPPEIAAALGVAVGTVHSRLARAMAQLRDEMEVRSADRSR
jgi:RNA polymerase sigma-70 factor (ECF subfamily)